MANVLGQIGPWMDLSWEIPTCTIVNPTGGTETASKPLTWKQYIMASVMLREARERKGSMNPFQAATQFLYTNDFTAGWAIHSTPYYGNTVITPRTIKIINRPAGIGIQRGHITVHNAYADEESYMIAVNPTFRPDPNKAFEVFGAGDASKQWITWDDVHTAVWAVGELSTWNAAVPMYQDGSTMQIDQFSPGNILMLRWAYRYARQHGIGICSALGQMRDSKNINVSLSTVGVDEFSGVTLQKTYHVYLAKQGWALKGKAFGPTLVIPPADVRDANHRNQNEDSRKRHKRIPPSWEYIMLEMMTIPHPTLDVNRVYSSALGFSTQTSANIWGRIAARAAWAAGQDPNRNAYTLIRDLIHADAVANGYSDITYMDSHTMQYYANDSNGCDAFCQEQYRAWAEDTNYGQGWETPSAAASLGEAVVRNPVTRGVNGLIEGTGPAPAGTTFVRG